MIYLVPEFKTASGEIMNVLNQKEEPVGYVACMYKENEKLYVFGTLKNKGEEQNFVDVVENYTTGMQEALGAQDDTRIFLDVAGEPVSLNKNGNDNGNEKEGNNNREQ